MEPGQSSEQSADRAMDTAEAGPSSAANTLGARGALSSGEEKGQGDGEEGKGKDPTQGRGGGREGGHYRKEAPAAAAVAAAVGGGAEVSAPSLQDAVMASVPRCAEAPLRQQRPPCSADTWMQRVRLTIAQALVVLSSQLTADHFVVFSHSGMFRE